MAEAEAGLELPIGLTEQKFMQQLARIEARSIRTAKMAENSFRQSNAASARSFVALERSAGSSLRKMQGLFRAGIGLFAGGVVARQMREYTRLADTATQMGNSLRVAGLEGEELTKVYDQLFRAAQRNSAPIDSLVNLYSKLALTQKELGVTSEELIQFTDGIAVALRVGGTDAQAASGALLQLSQALGSGIVRAEEFNSMLEGTPTIVQAVARGLKEAGGSVAELRRLVNDGQVSSAAFFRAFEVGSGQLREMAETADTTVGQAFTRLGNSLLDVVADFDEATGASGNFAEMIVRMSDGLDRVDVDGFVAKLQAIIDKFIEAEAAGTSFLNNIGNSDVFARFNEWTGATEDGQIVNPDVREAEAKIERLEDDVLTLQAQIENNTELGFDNTEAIARLREVRAELSALRVEAANMPRYVEGLRPGGDAVRSDVTTGTPFNFADYKPPPSSGGAAPVSIVDHPATGGGSSGGGRRGGGGGRRSGGGGGGRGRGREERPFFEDVERDLLNLQREIELIGKSNEQVATARARWELLDEAKKRGVPVNETLNAQIEAQATQVGRLTAELERAEIAQSEFEDRIDSIAGALSDVLVGGESLREGLAQVFKGIAADIMKSGIKQALMSAFGGGGGGGNWLSAILGGFGGGDPLRNALAGAGVRFEGGGFTGYGARSGGIDGRGGFPAILHPNETVIDHARGQRAGGMSYSPTFVIGGRVTAEDLAAVRQEAAMGFAQMQKSLPAQVQATMAQPRRRF